MDGAAGEQVEDIAGPVTKAFHVATQREHGQTCQIGQGQFLALGQATLQQCNALCRGGPGNSRDNTFI